jgi:hypothetical protein
VTANRDFTPSLQIELPRTTHNMADTAVTAIPADTANTGNLETLPLELRKDIYAHLLVETKKIPIKRFVEYKYGQGKPIRMDHHRNKKHPGKFYDRSQQQWVDAPPCTTSLLLVNSAVSLEATQVLYGFNQFEFEHACALWTFLEKIGESKQYLRHLAIIGRGVLYHNSTVAMSKAMRLLQHTPSLRSLEISHFALCDRFYGHRLTVFSLVLACAPMLKSLKITFEKEKLNVNVLDVIKTELPRCSAGSAEDHEEYHADWPPRRMYQRPGTNEIHECACLCAAAEARNRELIEELKKEIGQQLGSMK